MEDGLVQVGEILRERLVTLSPSTEFGSGSSASVPNREQNYRSVFPTRLFCFSVLLPLPFFFLGTLPASPLPHFKDLVFEAGLDPCPSVLPERGMCFEIGSLLLTVPVNFRLSVVQDSIVLFPFIYDVYHSF